MDLQVFSATKAKCKSWKKCKSMCMFNLYKIDIIFCELYPDMCIMLHIAKKLCVEKGKIL